MNRSTVTDDLTYSGQLANLQREILPILRAAESVQEHILPGKLPELQAEMVTIVRDTFRRFESTFVPLTPPPEMSEFHQKLIAAMRELSQAYDLFMSKPSPQWTLAFLHSRSALCRSLYLLYGIRDQLPLVAPYFSGTGRCAGHDGNGSDGTGFSLSPSSTGTGFIHRNRNEERSDYTLYIPENYSKEKPLPLIVALHGGYGQGSEYVWTWLRSARSSGYAVLSPKSFNETWDMSIPSIDTHSILRMLDEVTDEYSIDRSRIYLTGLSDGATFGYIFGLENANLFRAMAPIAGVLHPVLDPLLREGRGKDTPMLIIHGVHDFIFPVAFARSCVKLLEGIGYNLKYEELPDWGHAFPYSINERMVLPWFESLLTK